MQEGLSENKIKLLRKLKQKKRTSVSKIELSTTQKQTISDHLNPAPLSSGQERIWMLQQMEPDSAFYNMPTTVEFKGSLNTSILEKAIGKIFFRHHILRTFFKTLKDKPYQYVDKYACLSIDKISLTNLSCEEQNIQVQKIIAKEVNKPFDLGQAPLARAILISLSPVRHVFHLSFHHIIFDGLSTSIFIKEFLFYYQNLIQNNSDNSSELSPLPLQYADYSLQHNKKYKLDQLEKEIGFWRKQLSNGNVPLCDLPADKPRPANVSYIGKDYKFGISKAVTDNVKAFSQRNEITPFMTLLTIFYGLVYRYTGQSDVVVGTPISNRNQPELINLIGFFLNTIPLRMDVQSRDSFQEMLYKV